MLPKRFHLILLYTLFCNLYHSLGRFSRWQIYDYHFSLGVVGWCDGVVYVTSPVCVHLILVYSWARPAILVAGKGRGGCFYFFCFFTFIPVPLSSLSPSFISTISSISFLPISERWHKMTHRGWHVIKPNSINQSFFFIFPFNAKCLLNCIKSHSLFSGKNIKKYFKILSAENSTSHAKLSRKALQGFWPKCKDAFMTEI